jgi:hypothetical protein
MEQQSDSDKSSESEFDNNEGNAKFHNLDSSYYEGHTSANFDAQFMHDAWARIARPFLEASTGQRLHSGHIFI